MRIFDNSRISENRSQAIRDGLELSRTRQLGLSFLRATDVDAATLTTETFVRLREDLLVGRFRPGQKLRMEELRELYAVGFSPIREALMRLASEGLVIAEERRGFRAAPISARDLAGITFARQQIEALALRDSLEHVD